VKVLGTERLFLWGSEKGKLEGVIFSGKFGRYVKRALETEDLSLCRGSVRGTWKGCPLLETLRDM
jgi:hypothetical protein